MKTSNKPSTKSQRTHGFKGGVQAGTTSQTAESVKLEKLLRQAADIVAESRRDVVLVKRLSGAEIAQRLNFTHARVPGVAPDGGVWLDAETGQVLMAAEAKKQGVNGNAIERWYKNHAVVGAMGGEVYLTVCAGEGFFEERSAQLTLQLALAINEQGHGERRIWNSPNGRLWLYRYKDVDALTVDDMVRLLNRALNAARSRKRAA
jgi:hypothetical protein